jgi:hypothetical protein
LASEADGASGDDGHAAGQVEKLFGIHSAHRIVQGMASARGTEIRIRIPPLRHQTGEDIDVA